MLVAMAVALRPIALDELEDGRLAWVRRYRQRYPAADLWARGLRLVSHSIETQERVFRMAEQLERRGVDGTDVLMALEEADRCVALSNNPHVAVEAGHCAIGQLLSLDPQAIVICAEQQTRLQALGFDPVAFDGHDPAAYAWVMFELSTRADAERRARWRRVGRPGSSTPTSIGLARL